MDEGKKGSAHPNLGQDVLASLSFTASDTDSPFDAWRSLLGVLFDVLAPKNRTSGSFEASFTVHHLGTFLLCRSIADGGRHGRLLPRSGKPFVHGQSPPPGGIDPRRGIIQPAPRWQPQASYLCHARHRRRRREAAARPVSGRADVPLLGPEDLSCNDMAAILTEVLRWPVRFQQVSLEAFKEGLPHAACRRVSPWAMQRCLRPRIPVSTMPSRGRPRIRHRPASGSGVRRCSSRRSSARASSPPPQAGREVRYAQTDALERSAFSVKRFHVGGLRERPGHLGDEPAAPAIRPVEMNVMRCPGDCDCAHACSPS